MLEKSNTVRIDIATGRLLKASGSPFAAQVERTALKALERFATSEPGFRVPMLYGNLEGDSRFTSMSYVPGFMVHELLGILNEIVDFNFDKPLHRPAHTLKE